MLECHAAQLVLETTESHLVSCQKVGKGGERAHSGRDHVRPLLHFHHVGGHSEGPHRQYVNFVPVLHLEDAGIDVDRSFGGTVNSHSGREVYASA